MSKYDKLSRYLKNCSNTRLQTSFAEVERILGFALPESAYKYEAWWSNNETGHSHARSWLSVGWRTEAVDVRNKRVTLNRAGTAGNTSRKDPYGCMAGTVRIMPGVDLTMPAGENWTAERGELVNE